MNNLLSSACRRLIILLSYACRRLTILLSYACCLSALASVPVPWTVDVSDMTSKDVTAYRGETLDLAVTFAGYRPSVATATLYWQTNGMDNAWWSTNATYSAGVARATFTPAMDPGAPTVLFFVAVNDPGGTCYRASGRLRLSRSPGSNPASAPLPPPGGTIDFSRITVLNAPWATLEAAQSAVSTGVNQALNAVESLSNRAEQTYAKLSDIPAVPSIAGLATTGEVAAATADVLHTVSTNYQPIAGMSGYATKGYADDAANAAKAAAEANAATNYQPLAGMADYARKSDLPTDYLTETNLAGYATKSDVDSAVRSAVIGTANEDFAVRLLSSDGSTYQTADGSVFEISIVPAETNWIDVAWPTTPYKYQGDNTWSDGVDTLRWRDDDSTWELQDNLYGIYEANPAEGLQATNITLHNISHTIPDVVMSRVIIDPHPVTNKINQVIYTDTLAEATNDTLTAAKAYTDAHSGGGGGGGGSGLDTNAVADIANHAIATNATVSGLTSQVSSLSSSKRDIGDNDFHGDLGLYEGDLNIYSPFGIFAHFANIRGHDTFDEGWSNITVSTSESTETLPEYLDRRLPSSPSLRVYDAARGCWWIGAMVDGVINWTVEE